MGFRGSRVRIPASRPNSTNLMREHRRAALIWTAIALLSTAAHAQPQPTPIPSPTPKSAAETIVDQVAAAVRSGHLAVAVEFRPGKSPMMESWSLETTGTPTAHLTVDAAEGRVQSLDYHVDGGDLIFVGRGLKPSVIVSEISVDADGRLQKAAFHGRGIGRPIVALFRPLVLSSLKKIRFHTEVAELLRGNLVVGSEAPTRAAAS